MNHAIASIVSQDKPRRMLRVAVIGFGTIGSVLCRLLSDRPKQVEVTGVLVRNMPAPADSTQPAETSFRWKTSLQNLLDDKPDVIIECAGHGAVDTYGSEVLRAGSDLLLVSVGALADAGRYEQLANAALAGGSQLLIASGAIGGLDILSAARLAGLNRVFYRSRKPPQAWLGSAAEAIVDLLALKEPTVLFRGSAREAAVAYPKNANVAATIALAGIGFDDTSVELVADPGQLHNLHEIEADGASGTIRLQMQGLPAPGNPRTSVITAYSVVSQLLKRQAAIAI